MTVTSHRDNQLLLQGLPKPVNLEDFVAWYPENSAFRYELRGGVIIKMPKPSGKHSEVAGFIHGLLTLEIQRGQLGYFIPKECLIKRSEDTGYEPDVIVLDRQSLTLEPLWQAASVIERGESIKLVVEVVSGNWQDDYELKMAEYEALGIPEYWIVDYAGLGGVRHLGKPKQPTLTMATLIDGEYETRQFREAENISSPTFPELLLTAGQVMLLESSVTS